MATVIELRGGDGLVVMGSVDAVLDALSDEVVQFDGAAVFRFAHGDDLVAVLVSEVVNVRPAGHTDQERAGIVRARRG